MPAAVMKLKLGACLTRPTKKAHRILEQTALDCDRARNAALRYWLRWMEDHPDYEPQQRTDIKGNPKVNAKGEPIIEARGMPQGLKKQMYHYAGEQCPSLSRKIISQCTKDVAKFLESDMPYNHDGPSRHKWEALLNYEISPASFRSRSIPIQKQDTLACYDGAMLCGDPKKRGKPQYNDVLSVGVSSAVVRLALLSKHSGFSDRGLMFRFHASGLTLGHKRNLRKMASGEIAWSDSQLLYRDGAWFWMLAWKPPVEDLGLDPDRVAIVRPLPYTDKADTPFEIVFPEGHRWRVRGAKPLRAEHERIVARRASLRAKYRHRDSNRGHGKGRFYAKLRPYSRSVMLNVDLFCRNLRAEIIKGCQVHNCGRVEYREPTKPVRNHPAVWFNRYHIPFPWDVFGRNLGAKLEKNKFPVTKTKTGYKWKRLTMVEWRELLPDE